MGTHEARAYIRKYSRKAYAKSGKPYLCENCLLEEHIQICHIIPVSTLSDDDYITEINSIENLIALCPHCHSLLDFNRITIDSIRSKKHYDITYPDW